LAGLGYYARHGFFKTQWIVIDIDNDPGVAFGEIVARVIDLFEAHPLIIRSSNSLGVHLYYKLNREVETDSMRETVDTIFTHYLYNQNWLYERPLEIYPDTSRVLRYPLGRDSFLLGPNGKPIRKSLQLTLRFIKEILDSDQFKEVDYSRIERIAKSLQIQVQTPERKVSKVKFENQQILEMAQDYVDLKDNGLSHFGTRRQRFNSAVWYLVKYLKWSDEDAYSELSQILKNKHNGNSKDYNRKPQKAMGELWEFCHRYFKEAQNSKKNTDRRFWLLEKDIERTVMLAKKISSAKLTSCFLLSLLNHFYHFNTSTTRGKFTATVSSITLDSWPGGSTRRYKLIIDSLIKLEYLRISQYYYYDPERIASGMANEYELLWITELDQKDFDPGSLIKGNDLNSCLLQLFQKYVSKLLDLNVSKKKMAKCIKTIPTTLSHMLKGRRPIYPVQIYKLMLLHKKMAKTIKPIGRIVCAAGSIKAVGSINNNRAA